jgi:hypothetical protein
VADCDEDVGHCILGKIEDNPWSCKKETKAMWRPETISAVSCKSFKSVNEIIHVSQISQLHM